MRTFLIFDCETNALLDFKKDIMHESQPRIIQLAAILCNESGQIIEQMNMLAKPDGWEIDAGAQSVHGISLETCEAQGVPLCRQYSQGLMK
jgi:DNA polymerase III epsilon subunit-like protein